MNKIEDPYMINLKGIRVQVPACMVQDLLKKGFKLEDETWGERNKPQEIKFENRGNQIKTLNVEEI